MFYTNFKFDMQAKEEGSEPKQPSTSWLVSENKLQICSIGLFLMIFPNSKVVSMWIVSNICLSVSLVTINKVQDDYCRAVVTNVEISLSHDMDQVIMVSYGFPFVLSLTFLHFLATTVRRTDFLPSFLLQTKVKMPDIHGVCHAFGLLFIISPLYAAGNIYSSGFNLNILFSVKSVYILRRLVAAGQCVNCVSGCSLHRLHESVTSGQLCWLLPGSIAQRMIAAIYLEFGLISISPRRYHLSLTIFPWQITKLCGIPVIILIEYFSAGGVPIHRRSARIPGEPS